MREFFKKHLQLYRVYLCLVVVPIITPVFLIETLWVSLRESLGEFWYVWRETTLDYKEQLTRMWKEGVG